MAATAAYVTNLLAEAEAAVGAHPAAAAEAAAAAEPPQPTPGSAKAIAAAAAAARASLAIAVGDHGAAGGAQHSEGGTAGDDPATPTQAEPRYVSGEGHAQPHGPGSHDGLTHPAASRPVIDALQVMPDEQRRIEAMATHVDAAKRRQQTIKHLQDLEVTSSRAAPSPAASAAAASAPPADHPAAPAPPRPAAPPALQVPPSPQQPHAGEAAAASPHHSPAGRLAPSAAHAAAPASPKTAAAAASPKGTASTGGRNPHTKRAYKVLSVHALLHPAMRREFWSSDQFEVTKRLHKGYASEVYRATDKQSGEACAVKVYDVTQLGKLNKVQLIREIKLHGSFAHRNIVELWCSFQEGNQVALVQKFCEQGDLLKLLHKCGGRMNERASVQVGRPSVGDDKTLGAG
ncbi:hypothetical protein MNEG_14536 [Monoraphidium neglectum]|uniref:Protein kinase domain-containing protein n=1 Tax=Monoraphidium neglectum TaxID=145388 RepID=A0A0D2LUX1_9CHLO|nr:hypothetical protein MNEG_14536 [Monoraphidium neglectum]KIY93426.1 hypothetical protein MNEG_14536 [Monoraphidium neglectum]|eukprot:XP_013892446.1 hypothetical protein MNEG_14536 [Monoraphidium neglectum]